MKATFVSNDKAAFSFANGLVKAINERNCRQGCNTVYSLQIKQKSGLEEAYISIS